MPFTEEQVTRLTDVIHEYVPFAMLLDIVILLDTPTINVEAVKAWRKEYLDDKRPLAKRFVDTYRGRSMIPSLARALYRRFYRDDLVAPKFLEFCKDPGNLHATSQAAFALRVNTLDGPQLRKFLAETEPRICVVLAPQADGGLARGTGFLVGPDLIVTAHHTLTQQIYKGAPIPKAPGPCWAIFDHLYGDPIDSADPKDPGLRRVAFAKEWLVKADEKYDFALVRIEEPIGLESHAGNGGVRRHWFDYQKVNQIKRDERIIIPQHPNGYNLQHDFGRYIDCDNSGIHIQYTAETAPGSSGAPCFDGAYRLVGMHNSVYEPDNIPLFNQAVLFDHIATLISDRLRANSPPPPPKSELWSVTPSPLPPRPIIGREAFLNWMGFAEADNLKAEERVFVVEATAPHAGRNFTIEILKAARREAQDPVVVLGNERGPDGRRQPLPRRADDIVRLILQELPFTIGSNPFPQRPAIEVPGESKLDKWAATDLPRKLNEVLAINRTQTLDQGKVAIENARELRSRLEQDRARAKSAEGPQAIKRQLDLIENQVNSMQDEAEHAKGKILTQQRWERIWIAVMFPRETHLAAEVTELITGLVKTKQSELARIRWLLIGDVPNVLKALSSRKPEVLDPTAVAVEQYSHCVEQIALSVGFPLSPQYIDGIKGTATGIITASKNKPDPLGYLQEILANTSPAYKKMARTQDHAS